MHKYDILLRVLKVHLSSQENHTTLFISRKLNGTLSIMFVYIIILCLKSDWPTSIIEQNPNNFTFGTGHQIWCDRGMSVNGA